MLSAGAMGGGVSSAMARARCRRPRPRATLALHALFIGVVGGVPVRCCSCGAAPLFTLLGGRGDVLREALAYARCCSPARIAVWLFNTLASILRGTGNMRVPSAALVGVAVVQITLGGLLGLGLARCRDWACAVWRGPDPGAGPRCRVPVLVPASAGAAG